MVRITITKTTVIQFENDERDFALDIAHGVSRAMNGNGYAVETSIGRNSVRVTGRMFDTKGEK